MSSRKFHSCIFHPLHYRAEFSTPAFSTPCNTVPIFPLLHFPALQFWPCRFFHSRIFSAPLLVTKITIFHTPPVGLFNTSSEGDLCQYFVIIMWLWKNCIMGLAGGDKSLIIMFSRFDTFHKCNGRANEQAEFLYSTLYLVPANYLRRVVKLRRIGYAYGTPNRTPNQSDLKRRIYAALVLKFIRLRIYLHLHIYDCSALQADTIFLQTLSSRICRSCYAN